MPYKDPEKRKENRRRYYTENRERIQRLAREKRLEWRKKNPLKEKDKQFSSEIWRRANKQPKVRFSTARKNASKREISWDLSFEEFISFFDFPCFYCQNKLGLPVKSGIGLDRLDSAKSYNINNVVTCCYICNLIKNEFLSAQETKVAVQAILKYREDNNITECIDHRVGYQKLNKKRDEINNGTKPDTFVVTADQ
jgi:5-methylcytosine-specific restriction endonuclease McrA